MSDQPWVLGIDVGSVAVTVAEVNYLNQVTNSAYELHLGDVKAALSRALRRFDLGRIHGIAATSSTPSLIKAWKRYDNRVALIEAARFFPQPIGSILLVGGERFGVIHFDSQGNYSDFKANTSCAAGTGGFLDQQARRLKLAGIEEFSALASGNQGDVPKIASRCAVFAKTDLVHAQQEGFLLEEICDGLCQGLARNIFDTLFTVKKPAGPVLFTGGVARNRAVARHLEKLIGQKLIIDDRSVFQAAGAAMCLLHEPEIEWPGGPDSVEDLFEAKGKTRTYFYPPLDVTLASYPDFSSHSRYEFIPEKTGTNYPVEVDIYESPENGGPLEVFLGLDIGSTSTKAGLIDPDNQPLAGFYTRTAGRPVAAVQSLFEAIQSWAKGAKLTFRVLGLAVTGSGRKLAGKIFGADAVIDEITAHARAARQIDPRVDTIIEIGGQDSKFTTLENGMVTIAIMNNVCAAGTGSFIEEQAEKLGCPLDEISLRTEGRSSPIASDRCTVFMERDINHYLREGYEVDEVLMATLYSIRENYLNKVAIEASIGQNITFQGATAKIRSLVAVFEQRLDKTIQVSRYCHLTGALGAAFFLAEGRVGPTVFKGLDLYKERIPLHSEVCGLCPNNCTLTVAEIDGQKIGYGFMCGRDYDTGKYVDSNRSGFDLLKARPKTAKSGPKSKNGRSMTIGLPAGLYMREDLGFWQKFFQALDIDTITSQDFKMALKLGQTIARAEFCAPLTALHGHVRHLLDLADYVFLPGYLEKKVKEKGVRRQYCYYTQYAAVLAKDIPEHDQKHRIISPLVHYRYGRGTTLVQLYLRLRPILDRNKGFFDLSAAWDKACQFEEEQLRELKRIYREETAFGDDIHVVLLGRPYTVLSPQLNKGIPDIFAAQGIKAFFQDMLEYLPPDTARIEPLLNELHWLYAARILEAAEVLAVRDRAYPVLVTSFKCTPDSFVIEYFKQVMGQHKKPYLILQLDEHDSRVGYETRIEAAIRSFRNHHQNLSQKTRGPITVLNPVRENSLGDKTLVLPNWDDFTLPLIVANLRRLGIDARLMEQTPTSIEKGLRSNTGQCIPLNIIAQEFIDYVKKHDLDPARTAIWLADATIACNLGLFPYHIKNILSASGQGMEQASVYTGDISFLDLHYRSPVNTYFAFMFGGYLRRIGCRLRPYEKVRGATDQALAKSMALLIEAFSGNSSKESAVAETVSLFKAVDTVPRHRPQVAIFGDLFVRDNDVMNQGLIRFIEARGGEVVTTPYSQYLKMIAGPYVRKWLVEGHLYMALSSEAMISAFSRLEKTYYRYFQEILGRPEQVFNVPPGKILAEYGLGLENTGESMENILKIFYLKKSYPHLALLVQTSPAFCCPSLVTEAMASRIERITGVPIVSITYDGTKGDKNDLIIPFLRYPKQIDRDQVLPGVGAGLGSA